MSHTFLITGGAGFIGSALCRYLINNTNHKVINIDKLTYASNLRSLEDISENDRYFFKEVDICNTKKIINIFKTHRPDFVMHLAAESILIIPFLHQLTLLIQIFLVHTLCQGCKRIFLFSRLSQTKSI